MAIHMGAICRILLNYRKLHRCRLLLQLMYQDVIDYTCPLLELNKQIFSQMLFFSLMNHIVFHTIDFLIFVALVFCD